MLIKNLWKETVKLRLLGLRKIPLVFLTSPKVVEMSDKRIELKIPLNYITKNHLGSMYFGALCIGADMAIGLLGFAKIEEAKSKVSIIFKDVKAQFFRRPEGDVHFICEEGEGIENLISEAIATGERQSKAFKTYAVVPKIDKEKVVAEFYLTLSAKKIS